jgi:hypothetical protein
MEKHENKNAGRLARSSTLFSLISQNLKKILFTIFVVVVFL